ncbi:MAG: hypothetical protein ACW97P_01115 [Candidatus Hodarchaeales archaeon]|jgi:hypothetical protein
MSNKEIEDLKTLIKALDIRLRSEEISEAEYNELKAKYESKLDEELVLVKEKSFLKNLSYLSISGSGKVTDSYISISGSGKIEGWREGTIVISGSGKITEDEIKISGSGVLPGDLSTNAVKSSGSLKTEGSLETSTFKSSGSMKINGDLIVHETFKSSGAGKIDGNFQAKTASVVFSGAIKVNGEMVCDEAELSGAFKINGPVNCNGSFTAELSDKSTIDGDLISGGDIYIEQKSSRGFLVVESIQSDGEIYLEGVKTNSVRGKSVKVGDNCEIGSIEEAG